MSERTKSPWGAVTTAVTIAIALAGCAPASGPRAAEPPIASVWRARCGTCHARVEPGEKSNAVLKEAAKRHEKRVRLTTDQWDQLIAWLSPQAAAPTPAAAAEAPPAAAAPAAPSASP